MRITFDHAQQEAPQIKTYFFKPDAPLNYHAGQFVELTLPHEDSDNRGEKRWFTVSSSPTDELISITTRVLPDGSSFKQKLDTLKKGEPLHVSEPMGDFILPLDSKIPLVFVAAGLGITPFHSIIRWMNETNAAKRNIRLLHAIHSEDDIIFQDTFDTGGIHATIIVEDPSDAWGGERGTLDANHIIKLSEPQHDSLYYLAGPDSFIEEINHGLLSTGIANNQIITDKFTGYSSL